MAKWLSKDEIKRLRKHLEESEFLDKSHGRWASIRNRALCEFLLATGLRASECTAVKISDLSLEKSEPCLRVKTLKRRRTVTDTISISKEAAKILKDYLLQAKLYNKPCSNNDYLFPGRKGRMTLNGLEKAIQSILNKAGLSGYSAHSFRHTHGFFVYNTNMNLKLTQERLRHSSIQSTQIYVGVAPGEEQATINGLYS